MESGSGVEMPTSVRSFPNLELKMKRPALTDRLSHLKDVSGFVTEIANLMPNKHQPYVGDSAFAHKGGVHIHAVLKNPATYEHVDPARVGNRQRMLVSDYGGRSGLLDKIEAYGIKLAKNHTKVDELIHTLKGSRKSRLSVRRRRGIVRIADAKGHGEPQAVVSVTRVSRDC